MDSMARARSAAPSRAPRLLVSAPPRWTSRSARDGCRWPRLEHRRPPNRTSTPKKKSRRSPRTWRPSAPGRRSQILPSTTPANLSAEDLARGGELFRTNCSACHNFEGAGGALPNGKYAPPLVGVDDKRIYLAMLTGPQQMPVFSDEVLTPEDKRAIIGYLNALHEQPAAGGLALGGLGPVSEGLWAWIVGLGGLIFFAMWIAAKGAKAK